MKKIFPAADDEYLEQVANELNRDLARFGLDTVLRRAHFFAQVRQEGGAGLRSEEESLNYSPDGLKATFKYYRSHPDEAIADGYERDTKTRKIKRRADQQVVANKVYANRNGNGDVSSGDGWHYRGRGLIQVTGRANYVSATRQYRRVYGETGVDFEKTPSAMGTFPYTVRSAVCFWLQHDLHKLADRGSSAADVDRITRKVNPGTKSKPERRAHFTNAHNAFK